MLKNYCTKGGVCNGFEIDSDSQFPARSEATTEKCRVSLQTASTTRMVLLKKATVRVLFLERKMIENVYKGEM